MAVGDQSVPDGWEVVPSGAKPDAHMSAATPNTALPDTREGHLQATFGAPLLPQAVRDKLNTPLAHPTGIDMIDSLTSPVNLALGTVMEAPAAARLVTDAISGLTERMGSKLAAKVLKFALPSVLKKPAELADILTEFGKLGTKEPPVATAPAAATPAAPAAAAAAPPAVAEPAATSAPAAAQAPYNAGQAMNDVRAVFKGIKVAPLPAEVSNAAEMIRAGVPAETAVARIIAKRPGVPADAIEALAKKLGTPSDATVAARVADRNATGRWSQ